MRRIMLMKRKAREKNQEKEKEKYRYRRITILYVKGLSEEVNEGV